MDVYKLKIWLIDNRKKILILSHIVMAITLINLGVAIFNERFSLYLSFFMWTTILQVILFIVLQIMFKDNEE